MKLLVLSPHGAGTSYSGPAMFADRLFRSVARTETVELVIGRQRGETELPHWPSATHVLMTFPNYSRLRQAMWAVRCTWWLLRRARRFDCIHIHGAFAYTLIPVVAARAWRVPYVVFAASEGDVTGRESDSKPSWLKRALLSKAVATFALTDRIGSEFLASGVAPARVHRLASPVPAEFFDADPARPAEHVLGFVGKLGERKQPHLVLEALELLRRRGYGKLRATFIGPFESSAYADQFHREVESRGLERAIALPGHVRDVAHWLRTEIWLFILPSQLEGLPGALAEAMSVGIPCVVSAAGSMDEVMERSGAGIALERPDALALAAAIELFIKDRPKWLAASRNARRYAMENFSEQAVSDAYRAVLRAAVGTASKP